MLSVIKVLFCVFFDYFIFNFNSSDDEELFIPFGYHSRRVFIGCLFFIIINFIVIYQLTTILLLYYILIYNRITSLMILRNKLFYKTKKI